MRGKRNIKVAMESSLCVRSQCQVIANTFELRRSRYCQAGEGQEEKLTYLCIHISFLTFSECSLIYGELDSIGCIEQRAKRMERTIRMRVVMQREV